MRRSFPENMHLTILNLKFGYQMQLSIVILNIYGG